MEKDLIKSAIKEAFDEEIKPFYIEREQHWSDHQKTQKLNDNHISFIINSTKFLEALRDTFWRTIFKAIFVLIISCLTAGLIFWYKYHDKVPPVHK